jgi:hypothetical protein
MIINTNYYLLFIQICFRCLDKKLKLYFRILENEKEKENFT